MQSLPELVLRFRRKRKSVGLSLATYDLVSSLVSFLNDLKSKIKEIMLNGPTAIWLYIVKKFNACLITLSYKHIKESPIYLSCSGILMVANLRPTLINNITCLLYTSPSPRD